MCRFERDNNDDMFLQTLMSDKNWAAGAVAFVFVLIWAQTRSLALSVAAFTHILLSLPVAQFFYGVVLDIHWISFLQALPLFIIMGIGADDVFVFMDAWRRAIVDHPELAEPQNQVRDYTPPRIGNVAQTLPCMQTFHRSGIFTSVLS